MIKYEKYTLGDLETNCYLVWDVATKAAVIIDPADDGVFLADEIQNKQLKLKYILATHGHFDHLLGAIDLKLIFGVPFACSSKDMFLLERQQDTANHFLSRKVQAPNIRTIDVDLESTNMIGFGESSLELILSPGHTPGGVCFYSPEDTLLFSGDTIFWHSRGDARHNYSSYNFV